jgi:hypothetical protein
MAILTVLLVVGAVPLRVTSMRFVKIPGFANVNPVLSVTAF